MLHRLAETQVGTERQGGNQMREADRRTSGDHGVIVKRRIFEDFSRAPLPSIKFGTESGELGHSHIDFAGKFFILGKFAERSSARVDVVHQVIGLFDRLIRVVVEGGILDQFAGATLTPLNLIDDQVQLVYATVQFLIKLVTCNQLADAALPGADLVYQLLHFGQCLIRFVEEGRVIDELAY